MVPTFPCPCYTLFKHDNRYNCSRKGNRRNKFNSPRQHRWLTCRRQLSSSSSAAPLTYSRAGWPTPPVPGVASGGPVATRLLMRLRVLLKGNTCGDRGDAGTAAAVSQMATDGRTRNSPDRDSMDMFAATRTNPGDQALTHGSTGLASPHQQGEP
jgi:hypothetical protein